MIKRLPGEIELPNYTLHFEFEERERPEDDKVSYSNSFGELSLKDYRITILKLGGEFDKYLYSTFIIYSIANAFDVNLTKNKAYALGLFTYHILKNNDFLKLFRHFTKKPEFAPFIVSVPSFDLNVEYHTEEAAPLGIINVPKQRIQIYSECISSLKNVILTHELFEWANTMYNTRLKHIEIQSLSEGLVYVLNNNNFTS
jgi:hypothetical protein